MRHLIGIVLAIVLAAAVFCAATWGYARLAAQSSRSSRSSWAAGGASLLSDHHALLAFGALAATGLLAGILIAAPRVSPLAAGLPGLALLGLTVLYLVSVRRADQLIPLKSDVFGAGLETLLARGILAVAGLALIVPLFVPSRWRGRDGAGPADEYETAMAGDSELVGIVRASGDMPMSEAAAGPEDAAATARPAAGAAGAAGAVGGVRAVGALGASGRTDESAAAVSYGALPPRTPPPGIVY